MIALKMPDRSVLQSGAAALVALLLTSWLQIRPLGLVFIGFFVWWIYQSQCRLRITAPPELLQKFHNLADYLSAMRSERRGLFCAVSCAVLAVLALVGHWVSGSSMLLMLLLAVIGVAAKYNFKLTPIAQKDFAWSLPVNEVDLDAPFLPEVNESDLCLLERASTLASLSSNVDDEQGDDDKSDKSDEIPSDLLLPDKLPEINEHTDEEDDLVPVIDKSSKKTAAAAAAVLEADPPPHSMEFKKGHFKRDSSISTSSSEESLSKGLKFPDHTTVDGASSAPAIANDPVGQVLRSQTQALIANSANMLMTGLVQWGMGMGGAAAAGAEADQKTPTAKVTSIREIPNTTNAPRRVVTALDSSDESDFEILENEDFK